MKNKRKSTTLLMLSAILVCGLLLWHLGQTGRLWFNMPSQSKYPVRGVDASHYQGQMNWERIAEQGVTFAFLKATEGSGTVDDCFADNWKNARAAGLDALPPVIDLEFYRSDNLPDAQAVRENLRILLARMRGVYGKKPIIYTTRKCWETYLEGTDFDYTLWIRSIFTAPPRSITPEWTFWQYNPRGMLDGYTGGDVLIDLNIFRGSGEDFRRFAGYEIGGGES